MTAHDDLLTVRRLDGLDTNRKPGEYFGPRPLTMPLVRDDSGVVCEACGKHVDINGQCRCSA
jgi:hypothetical protein